MGASIEETLGDAAEPERNGAGATVVPARAVLARLILGGWALAMLLIGSALMAEHWIGLPLPQPEETTLQAALARLEPSTAGRWQLVHVLYAECRCSDRALQYLSGRASPHGVAERVLWAGQSGQRLEQARARGFFIHEVSRAALEREFGLRSAPLLIVIDPGGTPRYAGGYTVRKQGLDYQDLEILAELRRGGSAERLPAYGCAVSDELQSAVDPFGIKYAR